MKEKANKLHVIKCIKGTISIEIIILIIWKHEILICIFPRV